MPRLLLTMFAVAGLIPAYAAAQILSGGGLPDVIGGVAGPLAIDRLEQLSPARLADQLLTLRAERLTGLVQNSGGRVALDDRGQPAVSDVVLVTGANAATQAALKAAGFEWESETVEGLDLLLLRITVPEGRGLASTLRRVRKIAPEADVSADTLYTASGALESGAATPRASGVVPGRAVGMIDGGVAVHPTLTGRIEQRGFARGAPLGSAHGTAVASLIAGTGRIKGAAPGASLLAADVYGRDPAGGGALSIARALGWMASRGVGIVTISLVGPDNPLLGSAVRLAQKRGIVIVAAVGNDGPAAPPAFPASYPGVLAVTGVDGRDRALIEAGRAKHLDFAAPGADMLAASTNGGVTKVRGTSFATPLVAGRLLAVQGLAALAAEAVDLGKKGPDAVYGRGLICRACRNKS
ncbi:serine protease [Sphingobium sp. SCG-1]|uniref:S8 family serine peptidase n=1 Tax=Sphingobium sp. SCG-1 TaxID=2072936 RepID=UPI000CD67D43|nr:S8 family serine peptidase [Sphingobium sp. SCG-1]AUW59374.1 serine protease [Sphingobium sp. SCG-1]